MNTFKLAFASACLLPAALVVSGGCGSKDDRNGGAKPLATSSTTTTSTSSSVGGGGGAGAGVPGCDDSGSAGGAGGAAPEGTQRLGLRAEPRPDDEATILALGGTPFPEGDPDHEAKNAFLRVELGLGEESGKTTSLRLDHRVHGLSDEGWPDDYDAWTVGNDRRLLLSIPSLDKLGEVASYCEVAGTPAFDEAIASAAARIKTFVDDNVKHELYLAWGHDLFVRDGRPRLVALNSVTFNDTPDKVVVETREGVGVTCVFPKDSELVFTSPDGTDSIKAIAFEAGKVGDNDVYVSAPTGTVEPGWVLRYQDPTALAASYVASFKKVRSAMEAAWGTWSGKSKIRWTWAVPHDLAPSFDAVYPGDDEVDVIGVDAFNPHRLGSGAAWRELDAMLAGARTFAAAHGGKKLLVSAAASLDGFVSKTTEAAEPGPNVGVAVEPLLEAVATGTEIFFFDDAGRPLAKGTTAGPATSGSQTLPLDMLDAPVPAGAATLVRQPTQNKAVWLDNARKFVGDCAPEVLGVIYRTGGPFGFWLDQGPQSAPDVLGSFRGFALDPHFAGK